MYRRDAKSWLKHLDFMVLDLLVLQISFILAYGLRHNHYNPYDQPLYATMGVFIMLCDLVIIFFTEPFRNILKRGYFREAEAIFQQTLFIELFSVLFLFAQKTGESYSRASMFLLGILYAILSYLVRNVWKLVLKKYRREGKRSLLIVTTRTNAIKTVSNMIRSNYGMFTLTVNNQLLHRT